MSKRVFAFLLIICAFNTMTVCAESGSEVFTLFDSITFSSSLESIEERMENISYQKVARYGLFDQYGFYSDDALVFGEVADSVWFDMKSGSLIQIRILYEADSKVYDNVLNSLMDEYGISVFDYNENDSKVYAWWPDDVQIFFGGAPWDSSIEDAESGDVLSQVTITPYEKQYSYEDLLNIIFGK